MFPQLQPRSREADRKCRWFHPTRVETTKDVRPTFFSFSIAIRKRKQFFFPADVTPITTKRQIQPSSTHTRVFG
jgi:hypothetical protein